MYKTIVNGNTKTYKKCSYSKTGLENKCESALERNINGADGIYYFYKIKEINYLSSTNDDKYLCNEVICAWLLAKEPQGEERIRRFNKIQQITRNNSYIVGHDGKQKNPDSPRKEEITAKTELFKNNYKYIGQICDYQVPLKDYYRETEERDGTGRIDLLSVNEDESMVHLIELKKKDSKETMLRCVLESYTYYKLLNKERMLNDMKKNDLLNKEVYKYRIMVSPLVFEGSQPYREMQEMEIYRPQLQSLISSLNENEHAYDNKNNKQFFGGIEPFYLSENNGKYICSSFRKQEVM